MLRADETERVEDIFSQMDLDKDGNVTLEEFMESCTRDSKLLTLLTPNMTESKL